MDAFKEYIAMWKNYVNFSDRTNLRGYWMAVLWNVLAGAVIAGIGAALKTDALSYLYSVAALVPGLAITIRRLRDTGKDWKYIFMGLIPIAGWIIMVVYMTKPSVPDDGTPVV